MSSADARPHLNRVTAALEALAVHQATLAALHTDAAQTAVAARHDAAQPVTPAGADSGGHGPTGAGK